MHGKFNKWANHLHLWPSHSSALEWNGWPVGSPGCYGGQRVAMLYGWISGPFPGPGPAAFTCPTEQPSCWPLLFTMETGSRMWGSSIPEPLATAVPLLAGDSCGHHSATKAAPGIGRLSVGWKGTLRRLGEVTQGQATVSRLKLYPLPTITPETNQKGSGS